MTDEPDDEWTDDEAVEHYRQQLQEMLDRAAEMYRDGKDPADFFEKERADGRGTTAMFTVMADQLREVGSFLVDLPKDSPHSHQWARKHWVYQRISDKMMFVLAFPARSQLQRRGYTTIHALKPQRKN